jgi:signal transduction histidine kinase
MGTPSVLPRAEQRAWPRWISGVLLALPLALIAWQALSSSAPRMPPSLVLLVMFGPLATLFVSSLAGNVAFVLSLATLIGYWLSHDSALDAELALRSNLLIVISVTQLWVLGYAATFRKLRRQNLEQQQRIEQRLSERAELTRAISADLNQAVARLGAVLAPVAIATDALQPVQRDLERMMKRARETLHFRREPAIEVTSVIPDFRRRMTRWLFVFSVAMVTITLLRVVLTGRGPVPVTFVALVLYVTAFVGSERWPARRERFVGMLTVSAFLVISSAFLFWGFDEPPPNVLFFTTLGYNAFLLGSSAGAVFGIAGTCLMALVTVGALGAAETTWGALMLSAMVLLTIVMQACWWLLERRVLAIFASAQARAAELEHLEGFRARISGTLFHDVSNIVQVIGMTLQVAARGGLRPSDIDTLRRFHERLAALVKAAIELLENGQLAPTERVVGTELAPMFDELRELFHYRLEDKQQTLTAHGDTQLRVLTVPELLRDSILANLISNAIKFSPKGGTIALRAQRDGEQAQIVVRDQGPGFPAALVQKIANGERVESTRGTAGEEGLGLGLTLAAEHMRRIGGDLSLGTAAEGGGEAKLRVPLATPS